MKDALLAAIGTALDGLDIGFCAFDHQDRTLSWNRTFLALFPEHDGFVRVGEPYTDNLRRFYALRYPEASRENLERHVQDGLRRHREQRRPFDFDHRGGRVRVASYKVGAFGRVRVWRRIGPPGETAPAPRPAASGWAEHGAAVVLDRLANGVLVVDLADRAVWANQAFLAMYELPSLQAVMGRRYEELYRAVWRGKPAARTALVSDESLQLHLRYAGAPFEVTLPGDRVVRVIEQRGEVDGFGYFEHVDVTDLTRQKAALIDTEDRYRLLAEYSSDIILLVDGETIAYVSPAVTDLLGWQEHEVVGRPLADFCHPEDLAQAMSQTPASDEPLPRDYRARAIHRDGRLVWVEARSRDLPPDDGRPQGRRIINLRDIAARKVIEEELERVRWRLQELATTDPLTGLANRRKLDEALALEFRRAVRDRNPLSLLLIDIDHFKRLNDTFGHLAGDEVLRQLSALLARVPQRAGDLVARHGGEEFVILLPGAGLEQARTIAAGLVERVASTRFDGVVDRVTLSIGVACLAPPGPGDSPDTLLQRADESLYAAKRAGRNRSS